MIVSLDGRYIGEQITLAAVPAVTSNRRTVQPRHGDGEYIVVTDQHGTLLDYCGTAEELARYFPEMKT